MRKDELFRPNFSRNLRSASLTLIIFRKLPWVLKRFLGYHVSSETFTAAWNAHATAILTATYIAWLIANS